MKPPRGQLAVSIGILALGVLILAGAFYLPAGAGYAQVGPGVVPKFVGGGLILIAAALLREVFTGGYRGVDEEAEIHLPMDWVSFAWVSGGIVVYGLLVERVGYMTQAARIKQGMEQVRDEARIHSRTVRTIWSGRTSPCLIAITARDTIPIQAS